MFWAGWSDRDNEGFFTNVNTGKVLEKKDELYDIWWPGEPNGGVLENCAVCTVVELSGPHHDPRVYGLILERYRIVTEVAWSVSL